MKKQQISKEEFLSARQHLRQRFNALMPLIHKGKEWVNNAQRQGTYCGEDPSDESKGHGTEWSLQSTLIATALAHSRGNLHMRRFQTHKPGHDRIIDTLDQQEQFLEDYLNRFESRRAFAPMDSVTQTMLKLVAFSEKPKREELEEEMVSITVPEQVHMYEAVSV